MRPAAFITGIVGMAVVAGLLMAGEARLRGGTSGKETATIEQPATGTAADPTSKPNRPAAPISDTDAEIIARAAQPAPPPSPVPPAAAAAEPADTVRQQDAAAGQAAGSAAQKPMELTRPVAENAGILSFGGRRLQLAGIIPTPVDRICGPAGRQWPCGMMAKTALRQLLRNRSLTCDLDTAEWQGTVITACRLGAQDLGTWLAESGWAQAGPGSPLASVAEKAKQAQKGIYGGDPRRK
ncbi:thermonuclease family protein [Rhizobium sp. YTUHZ045]|uniref:thermonuclease family protein n=1 Tax=Rhizobium sp. YTUHZ045 TaxID=2962888 RepID=UPI003DA9F082